MPTNEANPIDIQFGVQFGVQFGIKFGVNDKHLMNNYHSEANYENTLIQLFQDLGYQYECVYE